jgi:glycerophosphoryl diester phosphodiesterase
MFQKTVIWAHRGASGKAPENTLAAFGLAELDGADGIELDVRMTADGVPVVMHDATLDRTSPTWPVLMPDAGSVRSSPKNRYQPWNRYFAKSRTVCS